MRLSKKAAAAVVAVMAAGGVAVVQSPALAASVQCELRDWSLKVKKCTTASIKPNKAHDIRITASLCKGSPYKVWDTTTGKTIASGTGKGQTKDVDRVINGLYGTYKAKLTSGCRYDWISIRDY
ncbi:hypothetical protein [Actinoplanes sp. M2I2]|uniref:hypothetical protein n=1 Tax=Actinoplanes sp. M2I2 TaxID=1734444 RepID=UPI00202222B1|nr:hypothetical protein [Actinoplanes sp. M2I2]